MLLLNLDTYKILRNKTLVLVFSKWFPYDLVNYDT